MRVRTQITAVARENGFTAREVARRVGLYPSNLSAMDAGRRSVSLQCLGRVAKFLGCSVADLLEEIPASPIQPFRHLKAFRGLRNRMRDTPDGSERGWTHTVLLSWLKHYRGRQP